MNNLIQPIEYTIPETGQVVTFDIVKNYLVKGNGNITDQETFFFISLCKAQKLNPFINDAYLIKFGNQPAQMVVGKDVLVKRANRHPAFEGYKAGIVVMDKDGNLIEREGAIKGKNELLVGGWCEVYRSDKKFPIKSSVSMEEYDKKQSSWKTMPMVMIRKCALVTALREAFPEELQGLYDADEIKNVPDADSLPQKEVIPGMASTQQKNKIMAMASQKNLYNFDDKKNTKELEYFCTSNGYDLKHLKFEEAEEVLQLLIEYDPKDDVTVEDEIQDIEFNEVNETDESNIEGQVSLL